MQHLQLKTNYCGSNKPIGPQGPKLQLLIELKLFEVLWPLSAIVLRQVKRYLCISSQNPMCKIDDV